MGSCAASSRSPPLRSGSADVRAAIATCAMLALGACEDRPPPAPDFAGDVTFDLGPPRDLPAPFGFDGNFLPTPDPSGTFVFSISDESGAPLPARVIFRPPPGNGFGDSLTDPPPPDGRQKGAATGASVSPGVVGVPEGLLLQTGYGTTAVPPGAYRLLFTRGPEYEAVEVEVAIAQGETQAVNVELERSVDTRGWLAADMHIHAALSFDSRVPLDRRAISMVSNGIELLVPTEHHGYYDFTQLLRELGYGPEIAGSLAGSELNFREGHAGVFPVPYDPVAPAGGSPPYQNLNADLVCSLPVVGTNCLTAIDAFALMRGLRPGGSIVTVNHPWFGSSDLGYFTNVGWGAGTGRPLPASLPTAGTFDAIELLNGYWLNSEAEAYLLADWFYLLSSGHRVTALGNSDTHGLKWIRGGWPRTMLRLPVDRPGDVTADMLYDAIRNQRAIATTGPFVTVQINGGQIGDVVRPRAGRVRIDIVVDAPTWISVDDVRLFHNGRELRHFPVPPDQRPRFVVTDVEEVTADGYYVVLATGRTPLPPDVVGEQSLVDGHSTFPFAITNPIYLDFDGDGVLTLPPPTDARLPWTPPVEPGHPMRQAIAGPGAAGPAGRDCDPRGQLDLTEHPPLDAMSQLIRDALPLLYP